MKLVINDLKRAEHFASIFKCIPEISDHVNIVFKQSNFYIQTMDQNHVCLFELSLRSEWFDEYMIGSSDTQHIGFNTTFFYSILKCRGKDQPIELSYEGDTDKLYITFAVSDDNYEKKL